MRSADAWPQGLKPRLFGHFTARLKLCPSQSKSNEFLEDRSTMAEETKAPSGESRPQHGGGDRPDRGGPRGPRPGGGPGGPREGGRKFFRRKKVCKFCT